MDSSAVGSGAEPRPVLNELEESMPPVLRPLPLAVMRSLSPDVVRRRLNLGGNGVLLESLALLPKRAVKTAPFTSTRRLDRLGGRVLRCSPMTSLHPRRCTSARSTRSRFLVRLIGITRPDRIPQAMRRNHRRFKRPSSARDEFDQFRLAERHELIP